MRNSSEEDSAPLPAPIPGINIDGRWCVPFLICANYFLITLFYSTLKKKKQPKLLLLPDHAQPGLLLLEDDHEQAANTTTITTITSSSSSSTSSPPPSSFSSYHRDIRHPFIAPSTAVAVRSHSHVAVASYSRTTSDLYGVAMQAPAEPRLGLLMAGMLPHTQFLFNYIKSFYGSSSSPLQVVALLAHLDVKTKQLWEDRPFMVGMLVTGWDESGTHLYSNVPDGTFREYRVFATGQNSEAANTYLERKFASGSTRDNLLKNTLFALRETALQGEQLTGSNCTVSVVGVDEEFHVLDKVIVQKMIDDFEIFGEKAPAEETFSLSHCLEEEMGQVAEETGGRVHQVNKAHKTRFASKSSFNLHKTTSSSLKDKHKIGKSDRNLAKGARAARIQRSKMLREQKRAAVLKEKRACSGTTSPPSVIGKRKLFDESSEEEDSISVSDHKAQDAEEKENDDDAPLTKSASKLRALKFKRDGVEQRKAGKFG